MKTKFFYTAILLVLLISSCKETNKECTNEKAKTSESTKGDYEHLVLATVWFQQSAEMQAIYIQSYNWAKIMLEKNLAEKSTKKQAAVVMDIDETILDNSPFEVKCIETGKGYSSETWLNWTATSNAKALPGALDFVKFADEKGVKVFFISNRLTKELKTTMDNMQNLGFPNIDSSFFLLKEETSGKKDRRTTVETEHEIILFVGDVLTDFSEIYEKRDEKLGKDLVEKDKELFGTKYIILPNPMYGEWEKAVYNNSFKWSEEQKDSLRKRVLISY
ncbi:MAG: 5'-nucleotidase, lipoprotein e(P4) family [Bacteroidales bacterium]|nr:5'-nucleotidase, lipoprotein e(P4) family [Bacteroidales bacterium]